MALAEMLDGSREQQASEALSGSMPQLTGAYNHLVERGDIERAASMALSISEFAFFRQDLAPLAWPARLVDLDEAKELDDRDQLLGAAAFSAWARNDMAAAERAAEEAIAVASARRRPTPINALLARFNVASYTGGDAFKTFMDLAGEIARNGSTRQQADLAVLETLGQTQMLQADAARSAGRRSLDLAEATQNPSTLAWANYAIGWSMLVDDPAGASRQFLAATRIASSVGNRWVSAMAESAMATAARRRGGGEQAAAMLGRTIDRWGRLSAVPQLVRACREAVLVFGARSEHSKVADTVAALEMIDGAHPLLPDDQAEYDAIVGHLAQAPSMMPPATLRELAAEVSSRLVD